ncbi:hypothetical protein [Paraburkholderia caribensis]|uniref:hypothetical protein n=1 Tax=Paraburkholderia caribensis TaxID=75105 RepID=UPI00078D2B29|nr:hypothetical protein [Paraburkholderia caribensis]AMV44280.1 hypothetical protein ATN79_20265 [Paraburkholderia caribensis]
MVTGNFAGVADKAYGITDEVEALIAMLPNQEAALRERDAQVLKLQETVDWQRAALTSRAAEAELIKQLNRAVPQNAVSSAQDCGHMF